MSKVDHSILVISRHIDYWFTEVVGISKKMWVYFFSQIENVPNYNIILTLQYPPGTEAHCQHCKGFCSQEWTFKAPPQKIQKKTNEEILFFIPKCNNVLYYSSTLCESLWTRQLLLTIVYYVVYSSSFTKKNTKQSKLLVVFQTCGRFWLDIPPKYNYYLTPWEI